MDNVGVAVSPPIDHRDVRLISAGYSGLVLGGCLTLGDDDVWPSLALLGYELAAGGTARMRSAPSHSH